MTSLGIVCTLRTEYETRVGELTPLVQIARAKRLNHLTEIDLQHLIERITPKASTDVALYSASKPLADIRIS